MAISTEDLRAVVAQARAAAEANGELRPARVGPLRSAVPERIRAAVGEDLVSGAYRQAVERAVAGDPELEQR